LREPTVPTCYILANKKMKIELNILSLIIMVTMTVECLDFVSVKLIHAVVKKCVSFLSLKLSWLELEQIVEFKFCPNFVEIL